MKRIEAIITRMKDIDAAQSKIERDCQLENDGQFSPEKREEYNSLKTEYDTLLAEKVQLEADAEAVASRAGRAEEMQPKIIARRTPANSGAPAPVSAGNLPGTPVQATADDDDEPRIPRFRIPANVKRIGTLRNFSGVVNGLDAEHRAYRFGMWALARITQDLPQRYQFRNATEFVKNYMGDALAIAHSESDGTTGGHSLVPEEFSRDLIDLREQYGVVRRLFGRETMSSDTKRIPKRVSGLTAYFVAENAVKPESNMSWGDILLVAKTLAVMARMSNQLAADAVINVGDTLAGEIAYAFSEKEDQAGFNGDGTSTYGGIQGARTLMTSIDGAGTDSAGLIIAAATGSWGAIVLTDFQRAIGLLPTFADTGNAAWVMHKAFYYGVAQRLELAAGGVTAMEIATGNRRPRPLFLGYPVEFSQVFPSVTAAAHVAALLGDFTKGAMFGDRQQVTITFSEHATIGGESVFERNQIAVRGDERFDINVHGAGTASVVGPIVGLATGT